MSRHRDPLAVGALAFVLAALVAPAPAAANTCHPAWPQIYPGWAIPGVYDVVTSHEPPVAVGRLCAIDIYAPAGGAERLSPEDLVITSNRGEVITFAPVVPESLVVERAYGCGDKPPEIMFLAFQHYTIVPDQPLPPSAGINIARQGQATALVQFVTTARLDMENCTAPPGLRSIQQCYPPIQDCRPPMQDPRPDSKKGDSRPLPAPHPGEPKPCAPSRNRTSCLDEPRIQTPPSSGDVPRCAGAPARCPPPEGGAAGS